MVENKAGAGGNIGADFVAKSDPDGHTLLIGYNGPIAVNVTLFENLPYDPLKDLAPITLVVTTPQFLVVHPGVPAQQRGGVRRPGEGDAGQALVRLGGDWQRLAPHHGDVQVGRGHRSGAHARTRARRPR